MRLADFIATNLEPILVEWEAFARTHIPAGEAMDVAGLRDHAADILKTVAADLRRPQTEREREEKSKGDAEPRPGAADTAAETHGALRAESGFTLGQMVSEFRALRASVIRLWRAAAGPPGGIGLRGPDAVQRGDRPGAGRIAHPVRPRPGALEGDVPGHPRARRPDAPRGHHQMLPESGAALARPSHVGARAEQTADGLDNSCRHCAAVANNELHAAAVPPALPRIA